MLRSIGRLPPSKACRLEARTTAKISTIRGRLSKDQYDIILGHRRYLLREIELQERKRTAHLAAPYREETRKIVEDIIRDKRVYQGFQGHNVGYKGNNGLKRTDGMMNGVAIRRQVADEDNDADINPKRRRYHVSQRDIMDWVSISFLICPLYVLNLRYHSEGHYY